MKTQPHTDYLNYIIEKKEYKSFCEIGTCNRNHNFNRINIEEKFCVDPDKNAEADFVGTSDQFFELCDKLRNPPTFDIFWIDGLHEAAQVRRDFNNALRFLNDGGIIGFHDCNPPTEATACWPRGSQREWCGTVFRFAVSLHGYDGLERRTIDNDYGCMFIKKPNLGPGIIGDVSFLPWSEFDKDRKKLLDLVTFEEFKNWL